MRENVNAVSILRRALKDDSKNQTFMIEIFCLVERFFYYILDTYWMHEDLE